MTPNQDLIDDYLAHLTQHGHPQSTTTTYRAPLRRADRELPSGLLAEDYELADWLTGQPSAATRALYRTALVGFYRWAVEAKRLSCDPSNDLPRVKRPRRQPRPTSHEQAQRIFTEAREPVRLWSQWMAYAGLRCIEIARLRLPDDVTEDLMYVHGKGDREEVVPTHPDLWAAVSDIPAVLVAHGLKPGWLGGGLDRRQISNRCNDEYRRLGLTGVTAHRFRHWYGTYVQRDGGGDVRVTQKLLRHQHVSTTEIYTAVSQQAMRSAVLALPTFAAS